MNAIEAVRQVARITGVPLQHIGRELGKRDNYISAYTTNKRDPKTATAAKMLATCGYVLAAVPADRVDDSMLVIDPSNEE